MSEASEARLLVVDDLEANRHLLTRLIAGQGHRIDVAADGQQALVKLASESYDLVLLDIMMPVLNGYDTLLRLKADERLQHIPVIVVSALSEVDTVVRCIEAGAEDYLTKPFNRVLLQARIAACLEKKRLRDRERQYLELIHNELTVGQRIQADFLPRQMPIIPGWEVAARFRPAHEVAGDFYDAFVLPGGRVAIVIADVCDKGIGAALFMALVRTLLRVFAELARPDAGTNAAAAPRATLGALTAIRRMNDYLIAHHLRTNMFASVFFGVLDPERGTLAYVNAGHDPPFHVGRTGLKARLTKTGPAVGTLPEAVYAWQEIPLAPGDVVLAYTDGVTDARDPVGAFYTDERLGQFVVRSAAQDGCTAAALLDAIEQEVGAHTGGASPTDDVTLLGVRCRSVGE